MVLPEASLIFINLLVFFNIYEKFNFLFQFLITYWLTLIVMMQTWTIYLENFSCFTNETKV